MYAYLKFNLDDPDDKHSFECASQGPNMSLVLWELDQELRKIVKYGDETTHTEKELDLAEKLRSMLWELLNSHNVTCIE